MTVPEMQLFERLGVALALGLLIGTERGWERRDLPEGQRVAGLRTFGLIGLLGGVTVLVAEPPRSLPLAAVGLVLGAVLGLGYWRASEREQDLSITSVVAALLTFGLGALAADGEIAAAASTAVVVTLLLGVKPELHGLLQRVERQELLATLRLLLISVGLLPILPDKSYGPWQAFNPYQIWWMVVLIAGISYVGYFAIKLVGTRSGLLLTGLFGGLVSSTAVAISLARRGRDCDRAQQDTLAAAVVGASATMFPRMLLIAAAVAPELFTPLLPPLIVASAVAFGGAAWYAWRSSLDPQGGAAGELVPQNPLDLWFALKFGLLLAVIMILARAAQATMGSHGLYVLAGISGLADVDAITLSVASMLTQGQTRLPSATLAILMCAAVNTVVKPAFVSAISGGRMALLVWVPLLAGLMAGGVVLWLTVLR